MPNNRLDFESIDQVEVFKENGDVIGTVKVSGVRSIEAAIVNFQRFPTLDAKKLVNAPKMSAHHRGICHF